MTDAILHTFDEHNLPKRRDMPRRDRLDEPSARLSIPTQRATAWKCYQRELAAVRELVDADEVREHVDLQIHRSTDSIVRRCGDHG